MFAVPAMAQVNGPDFEMPDLTFGTWPDNSNFDSVTSGTQFATSAFGGDAANDLTVEKDQESGMQYQWGNNTATAAVEMARLMAFDNKVINVERIDSGNQLAAAFGPGSVSRNSITVKSTQKTDDVDLVDLAALQNV